MTELQLRLMRQQLKIEIKTWDSGHRMQLTREPALKTIERLTGVKFGRGLQGRQDALEWLEAVALDNGIELTN